MGVAPGKEGGRLNVQHTGGEPNSAVHAPLLVEICHFFVQRPIVCLLALPTLNAQRFAAAVNAGDYPAAEQLCLDRERPFPGTWKKHRTFQPKATVKSLSLSDLRRGKRQLFVGIAYGDGDGLATCGVECTATKQGIEIGMSLP